MDNKTAPSAKDKPAKSALEMLQFTYDENSSEDDENSAGVTERENEKINETESDQTESAKAEKIDTVTDIATKEMPTDKSSDNKLEAETKEGEKSSLTNSENTDNEIPVSSSTQEEGTAKISVADDVRKTENKPETNDRKMCDTDVLTEKSNTSKPSVSESNNITDSLHSKTDSSATTTSNEKIQPPTIEDSISSKTEVKEDANITSKVPITEAIPVEKSDKSNKESKVIKTVTTSIPESTATLPSLDANEIDVASTSLCEQNVVSDSKSISTTKDVAMEKLELKQTDVLIVNPEKSQSLSKEDEKKECSTITDKTDPSITSNKSDLEVKVNNESLPVGEKPSVKSAEKEKVLSEDVKGGKETNLTVTVTQSTVENPPTMSKTSVVEKSSAVPKTEAPQNNQKESTHDDTKMLKISNVLQDPHKVTTKELNTVKHETSNSASQVIVSQPSTVIEDSNNISVDKEPTIQQTESTDLIKETGPTEKTPHYDTFPANKSSELAIKAQPSVKPITTKAGIEEKPLSKHIEKQTENAIKETELPSVKLPEKSMEETNKMSLIAPKIGSLEEIPLPDLKPVSAEAPKTIESVKNDSPVSSKKSSPSVMEDQSGDVLTVGTSASKETAVKTNEIVSSPDATQTKVSEVNVKRVTSENKVSSSSAELESKDVKKSVPEEDKNSVKETVSSTVPKPQKLLSENKEVLPKPAVTLDLKDDNSKNENKPEKSIDAKVVQDQTVVSQLDKTKKPIVEDTTKPDNITNQKPPDAQQTLSKNEPNDSTVPVRGKDTSEPPKRVKLVRPKYTANPQTMSKPEPSITKPPLTLSTEKVTEVVDTTKTIKTPVTKEPVHQVEPSEVKKATIKQSDVKPEVKFGDTGKEPQPPVSGQDLSSSVSKKSEDVSSKAEEKQPEKVIAVTVPQPSSQDTSESITKTISVKQECKDIVESPKITSVKEAETISAKVVQIPEAISKDDLDTSGKGDSFVSQPVKTPDSPKRVKLVRPMSKKPAERPPQAATGSLDSKLLRQRLEENKEEIPKPVKRKIEDTTETVLAKRPDLTTDIPKTESSNSKITPPNVPVTVETVPVKRPEKPIKISTPIEPAAFKIREVPEKNIDSIMERAEYEQLKKQLSNNPIAPTVQQTPKLMKPAEVKPMDIKLILEGDLLSGQKDDSKQAKDQFGVDVLKEQVLQKPLVIKKPEESSTQKKQLEYTLKIGKDSTKMIPKDDSKSVQKISERVVSPKETLKVKDILGDSDVTITPIITHESVKMSKVGKEGNRYDMKPEQEKWKHLTDIKIVPVTDNKSSIAKSAIVEKLIKAENHESAVLTTPRGVEINLNSTKVNALISESHASSSSDDVQFIKVIPAAPEMKPNPLAIPLVKPEMIPMQPIKRRRGRPRKIPLEPRPPMAGDMQHIEMNSGHPNEYGVSLFPVPLFDMSETMFTPGHHPLFPGQVPPSDVRPQRSCRGRGRLTSVRTRRPRGSSMSGRISSGRGRGRGYKRRFTEDENIITIDNVEQEMMRHKTPGRRRLSGGSRMDDSEDGVGELKEGETKEERKRVRGEKVKRRREGKKMRLIEINRLRQEAREKEKADAISAALGDEETRMSAPEGVNKDELEGLYNDLLERRRFEGEGLEVAPTPKRRREHYHCCICLEESPLRKLTQPLDHRSWDVLYKAAIVRQFEPILKLTDDLTKDIPPTVLYHRNCRSEFTHKKTLAKLTESTENELTGIEQQNADGTTGGKDVNVEQVAEYQWPLQGGELYMLQEQISTYLGVKSFKRKYPDIARRSVEMEERQYLCEHGHVAESLCDLGLTAVSSAEVLDIMFADFPEKYEELRKHMREKQARELSSKQKAALCSLLDKKKVEQKPDSKQDAIQSAASWNSNLNKSRKENRRCSLDLQSLVVHYPKSKCAKMTPSEPRKVGNYPVTLIPGQFCDFYKSYTPDELRYYPLDTVLYGPILPNERHSGGSDGSQSDSDDSSSSDDSSDTSSEGTQDTEEACEEDNKERVKEKIVDEQHCKVCGGDKTRNKQDNPEVLVQCAQCTKCSQSQFLKNIRKCSVKLYDAAYE